MRVPRDHDRKLLEHARSMRSVPTDAERKLWSILRGSQLANFKFRRQYPVANFILDFYCVKARLAVEVDGGQHNDSLGRNYDDDRTEKLNELGVRIVRFWNDDLLKHPDVVADKICECLDEPSPQPSPGVPGEGAGQSKSASAVLK